MKIGLICCYLLINVNGFSQLKLENTDSLKKQLNTNISLSDKAKINGLLAWELRHKNTQEANQFADVEINYGYEKKDYLKLAEGYRAKATIYVSMKKMLLAIAYYDSCMKYARLADSKFYEASCYSLQAGMYGDNGDYNRAIELYSLGLEVAKKANNNYILAVLSNNLADAYQYTNRNTKLVQENFKIAIQSSMLDKDYWGASLSAGNLAREYANNKQFDSMRKYMAQAETIFERPDAKPYYRASVCNELATIYLILKKPEKSIPFASMSRKVLDSLNRLDNVLQPISLLMRANYELNNINQAETLANELLKLSIRQNGKLYIRDAYKTLSDIAKLKNDFKNSLYYFEQYKFWDDSIFSIASDQSISNMEMKSLLAEKEFETKYEAQKKVTENKQLAQKNNSLTWQKWIAIVSSICLMILGILLFNAYRKKQKVNKQLVHEKLIVEQQANEKAILISEIHHRVKNNLTMLKSLLFLQARASNNEETKRILEESQARINSMALVHKNLYDDNENGKLNFPLFIENLLGELAISYRDKTNDINLNVEGTCDELDIETAIPLALMMNELATNSFKYAFENNKNGLINVMISQKEKKITIHYSDNGKGLANDFDMTKGGFGFKVLNILSHQINATIRYEKVNNHSAFIITI